MTPDAVLPVILSTGFLGAVLFIGWLINRSLHRHADPDYRPVYENKPFSASSENTSSVNKETPNASNVPTHIQHLIVGSGAAGLFAARAIRASDPTAKVLMIAGDERFGEAPIAETGGDIPPPYIRPLLSKGLWWRKPKRRAQMLNADGDIRKHSWLYYEPPSFFIDPVDIDSAEHGGISLLRNNPVVQLHPDKHCAILANGHSITYDCCLLATGSKPVRLPELEVCSLTGTDLLKNGRVSYFRNLQDYTRLQTLSDKLHASGGTIAVIGGGPLGSELAVSIAGESKSSGDKKNPVSPSDFSVLHFFRGDAPLRKLLPPILALSVRKAEENISVKVQPLSSVARIALENPIESVSKSKLRLTVHRKQPDETFVEEYILVDHVVCAVGVQPRVELAKNAGLELDPSNGGFLVNAEMESRADIYVAGEVASCWDPQIQYRRRIEHLNHAEESGTFAGLNMARAALSSSTDPTEKLSSNNIYDPRQRVSQYQPSMWCTLGPGAAWDAVGIIDSQKLLTRTFVLNGSDKKKPLESDTTYPGLVFYLTPTAKQIVGILLWNLPEDIFFDKEYAAPSRLHLARKIIAEQHTINNDAEEIEQLSKLACQFDMVKEIADSYAELKSFTESKMIESMEDHKKSADESSEIKTNSPETEIPSST